MLTENIIDTDSMGPFGDADGSRVEIKEAIKGFIDFSEFAGFSGLVLKEDDISKRVIVGKKGAGKTIYMRRIQDFCSNMNKINSNSIFISDISYDSPETRHIIKISQFYTINELSGIWSRIWKIAILKSVYTHIFFNKILSRKIKFHEKEQFTLKFKTILPLDKTQSSIYSQLKNIIVDARSKIVLEKYLDNFLWDNFEVELGEIMKNLPPLYFFLDGVDDEFSKAPFYWLKCQEGLFEAIFKMLRNQSYGGRLHTLVCLRESVYSKILDGEHATRYIYESKIKILNWKSESIRYFLRKKIEILDEKYFLRENSGTKSLEDLLNLDSIILPTRNNFKENIEDYILRHTRLLPRDIVTIGNSLCEMIEEAQHFNKIDSVKILKQSINKCAKIFAQEQIAQCSSMITSNWMYNGADNNDDTDLYTGDKEMIKGAGDFFGKLITHIGFDRFPYSIIEECCNCISLFGFKENDEPFNVLWLHGLLGYVDKFGLNADKEIFFGESESPKLPLNREEYVFHSVLIDFLNIKPVRKPVYV